MWIVLYVCNCTHNRTNKISCILYLVSWKLFEMLQQCCNSSTGALQCVVLMTNKSSTVCGFVLVMMPGGILGEICGSGRNIAAKHAGQDPDGAVGLLNHKQAYRQLWHLVSVTIFGVMYDHTFSQLAYHRWIEEKGYILYKMNHSFFLFTRATPGTPASNIYCYCMTLTLVINIVTVCHSRVWHCILIVLHCYVSQWYCMTLADVTVSLCAIHHVSQQ